jgi:hypothetical protein
MTWNLKQKARLMTPFENAANFVNSLAENLYASYAMMRYVPVIEDLQSEADAAVMRQDFAAIANITLAEAALQQQISLLSYDA